MPRGALVGQVKPVRIEELLAVNDMKIVGCQNERFGREFRIRLSSEDTFRTVAMLWRSLPPVGHPASLSRAFPRPPTPSHLGRSGSMRSSTTASASSPDARASGCGCRPNSADQPSPWVNAGKVNIGSWFAVAYEAWKTTPALPFLCSVQTTGDARARVATTDRQTGGPTSHQTNTDR
jgi:hypothetical protein